MRYRRARVNGGAYFFTVNLAERHQSLLVEDIDVLRKVVDMVQERHHFAIDAKVILPEHLHAVWALPPGDAGYPRRWMLIQAGLSRHIPRGERRSASRTSKGERGIWQRRYWEHLIREEGDLARHVDCIHFNPVKHGHVPRAADWPYFKRPPLCRGRDD